MWLLVLFQNLQSSKNPLVALALVAGHLGEGLLELLVDRLELLLLGDQLVLQSVHLHRGGESGNDNNSDDDRVVHERVIQPSHLQYMFCTTCNLQILTASKTYNSEQKRRARSQATLRLKKSAPSQNIKHNFILL